MTVIYTLRAKDSSVIEYVGITDFPDKRLIQHLSKPANPRLKAWIESFADKNDIVMEVIEEGSGCIIDHERPYIGEYLWRNPDLKNNSGFVFGGKRTRQGRPIRACSSCGKSKWYKYARKTERRTK